MNGSSKSGARKPFIRQLFFEQILVLFVSLNTVGCQKSRFEADLSVPEPEAFPRRFQVLKVEAHQLAAVPEANCLRVVAGGDVMLGHWTLDYLEREGADYPFRAIKHLLSNADIVFANLEAPFADSGRAYEKRFTFRVPTRYANGLRQAGFNFLSLANNHILDFGLDGLRQTLAALKQEQIQFAGAGLSREAAWRPAVFDTRAGRVAGLAFSMTFPKEFWATDSTGGTAYPYEERFVHYLDSLDQEVDFLIVSFHWGAEKWETPKDYQIYFAHLAIDHGADLVIGHHPHVLQGFELYKNRLIAYSLGNLAFASYSSVAIHSALLKAVLHRDGLLFARIYPLNVDNVEVEFQPQPTDSIQTRTILSKLDSLSFALNGRDIINNDGIILGSFAPSLATVNLKKTADE